MVDNVGVFEQKGTGVQQPKTKIFGTIAEQDASAVAITGGDVSGTKLRRSIGNTLTAAGSTQGDALLLAAEVNIVTTAAASTGVRLPAVTAADVGREFEVHNLGASTLAVYPATGGTINGGSANASVSIATTKARKFVVRAADSWMSILGA